MTAARTGPPAAGAKGYARLRQADVDQRFPGLLDSVLNADTAIRV